MLMRLSPTHCRIQLFVFSLVCLHIIIPPPCNLYEAPAPHAVTPQGRDSVALFVQRGHLFVVISPFFILIILSFCQGCSMWSGCELNAFEYSSQGGSEIYTPDVISGSDTVKNLQISFKKKKEIPSLCRSWYYQCTHIPVRLKKNRSVYVLVWNGVIRVLKKKNNNPLC